MLSTLSFFFSRHLRAARRFCSRRRLRLTASLFDVLRISDDPVTSVCICPYIQKSWISRLSNAIKNQIKAADKSFWEFGICEVVWSEKLITIQTQEWYSRVYHPTRHIIGHFGDDFTGQMTQPTASYHWRTMVSQPHRWPVPSGSAH